MSKVHQRVQDDDYDHEHGGLVDDQESTKVEQSTNSPCVISSRHDSTKQSLYMKVFYKHHPLLVTLDTVAKINLIKLSVAQFIGATIHKSNQSASGWRYPFNDY